MPYISLAHVRTSCPTLMICCGQMARLSQFTKIVCCEHPHLCALLAKTHALSQTHTRPLSFFFASKSMFNIALRVGARFSRCAGTCLSAQPQTRSRTNTRTNQAALFTRRVTSHNAMLRAHPRAQAIAQRSRLVSREHVTERRVEIKRRSREGWQWLARQRCGVVGQSDEGTNTAAIGRNSDVSHIDGGHGPEKSLLRRVRRSSTKQPN